MTNSDQEILRFVESTNLNDSLLVGYYGGGNFGDELLLEVLLNLLNQHQPDSRLNIYYLNPEWFNRYHRNFGHTVIDGRSLLASAKGFFRSRNVIVGGGGLWGLDFNPKAMILSVMLFLARVFGKKVYLLGVGYYDSTSVYGRIGAWLASRFATQVFARDKETYRNFSRITKQTVLAADFSNYLPCLKETGYGRAIKEVTEALDITHKTALICMRNFSSNLLKHLEAVITETVENNPKLPIVLGILEPKEINPRGYSFIYSLAKNHPDCKIIDFRFNPVAFYWFMKQNRRKLLVVAPHYHAIAVAYAAGIAYLPIVYDNKTTQLLNEFGVGEQIALKDLNTKHVQAFLDQGV